MARSRNIKPSIMDNEELAALEPLTRLLFIYLWMLADREGRLEDRPARIAKQALGYDRAADVGSMLDELQRAGFIARYTVDGKVCIQVLAFADHQTPHIREAASTLPAMPSLGGCEHQPRQVQERERDDTHLAESLRRLVIDRDGGVCLSCGADSDLHVDHIVPRARGGATVEGNLQTLCRACNQRKGARNQDDFRKHNLGTDEHQPRSPDSGFRIPDPGLLIPVVPPPTAAEPKPSRKKPKTGLPEDFTPSATGCRLCTEAGFSVSDEVEKFKNHHTAAGSLMADWQAGFRTWIDKAKSFRKPWQVPVGVTVPAPANADAALRKLDADKALTAPPPAEIRAQIANALKGKVMTAQGAH